MYQPQGPLKHTKSVVVDVDQAFNFVPCCVFDLHALDTTLEVVVAAPSTLPDVPCQHPKFPPEFNRV